MANKITPSAAATVAAAATSASSAAAAAVALNTPSQPWLSLSGVLQVSADGVLTLVVRLVVCVILADISEPWLPLASLPGLLLLLSPVRLLLQLPPSLLALLRVAMVL